MSDTCMQEIRTGHVCGFVTEAHKVIEQLRAERDEARAQLKAAQADTHLHTFRADGTCECGASPIPEWSDTTQGGVSERSKR